MPPVTSPHSLVQHRGSLLQPISKQIFRCKQPPFEVTLYVLANPVSNKPACIVINTGCNQYALRLNQLQEDFQKFRQLAIKLMENFCEQLEFCRHLEDPFFQAILLQRCEDGPIMFDYLNDLDLQQTLWNDISSSLLHQTSMLKSVWPIESKEARLRSELGKLKITSPKKLQEFFQEYSNTSMLLGSYLDTMVPGSCRKTFTPWEGGKGHMDRFRLWECGFAYIQPTEKLNVIGYLGFLEEDIVVMVGTQTDKVYMDNDEIVYIAAESLEEFAQQGIQKDPKFFDYYEKRPKDDNSLSCAAGTFRNKDIMVEVPEDCRWTFIDHDPEKLEADDQEARQIYAEMESFFNTPSLDCPDEQETCKVQ